MQKGLCSCVLILLTGGTLTAEELPATSPYQVPPAPSPASPFAKIDNVYGQLQEQPALSCCNEQPACGSLFWFQTDYLLWWTKSNRLPPLVTTGSPADANPGALGQPGTSVLFGGSANSQPYSGGRFSAGLWFNRENTLGIEAGYFFLGERTSRFTAASDGTQVLGRPFYDVTPGSAFANAENVDLLAFPGLASGSVAVSLSTRLQGYETNLMSRIIANDSFRVNLLAGFRYLQLDDDLSFSESSTFLPGVPVFGAANVVSSSSFSTQNRFYGGQFGADATAYLGRFSLNLRGMIGFGSTHETVTINGTTTTTSPVGITNTVASGPFALPSNIGAYSRDVFSVVPEVRLNAGYQMTDHVRLNVGYSFLAWTNVARPGDQIDRVTNTSQIPPPVGPGNLIGPARPQFSFGDSTFWAQGINFGVEVRY